MSATNIKLSTFNQIFIKKNFTDKILQFSPPRSGSTLVYNILREIFPEKEVLKQHTYKHVISRYPVVVSYRHPLDCIASSIQRYGLSPTKEVIEQQIIEFEENGISDILRIKNKKNVLLLSNTPDSFGAVCRKAIHRIECRCNQNTLHQWIA